MAKKKSKGALAVPIDADYAGLLNRLAMLLEQGRRSAVRTTNAILAAIYWEVGRYIVEYEQGGQAKAEYGEVLLKRLGQDLTSKYGRGFGWRNLFSMRNFYLGWEMLQTPSGKWQARVKCPMLASESRNEKVQTVSEAADARNGFRLPSREPRVPSRGCQERFSGGENRSWHPTLPARLRRVVQLVEAITLRHRRRGRDLDCISLAGHQPAVPACWWVIRSKGQPGSSRLKNGCNLFLGTAG